MHQPWYRAGAHGDYALPWVYLHAIKDYADMAAHLEAHPRMRAVVNFAPVLLEQLADYHARLDEWLRSGRRTNEPLLNLLAGADPVPAAVEDRAALVEACSRAQERHMIDAHPAYRALLDHVTNAGGKPDPALLAYLDEQYFLDLLTWYHLAWTGHSLRDDPVVMELTTQGRFFGTAERKRLVTLVRDTIATLIPRYRALAERGQVELSTTPYAHPIVPLLIDFDAMACCQPGAPRPASARYPGGIERARWHLQRGLDVFESHFGQRPAGVWLSEGAVSDEAVRVLDDLGIAWTASGEGVWANTVNADVGAAQDRRSLFRGHRLDDCGTRVFFRDDGLSDLIGFEYQQWDAREAAADFVKHVRNIAAFLEGGGEDHVISVILDGENAWEHYPDNGYAFLDALYGALADCDAVEIATFSESVAACAPLECRGLCAGSWVFGSFSTWIGERDKNRAWDRLVEAKRQFDRVGRDDVDAATRAAMEHQLAVCEGSDWFWWFGDDNPQTSVRDFDRLYRRQLAMLYEMTGESVPASLDEPLSAGVLDASGGAMRRGGQH